MALMLVLIVWILADVSKKISVSSAEKRAEDYRQAIAEEADRIEEENRIIRAERIRKVFPDGTKEEICSYEEGQNE